MIKVDLQSGLKIWKILNNSQNGGDDMYQKERIDSIMEILNENGYVTVKYLTEELHYSTATINRDLNDMVKQNLIKRSYGGVELIKERGVPLPFRYHKMKSIKNKLGKKAAEFINDGDRIFIDGSTTTQYIGKYIIDKKDLTVITNNITLASFLSEHGIEVICLGGKIVEIPSMVGGMDTAGHAMKYKADKLFFSVGELSEEGVLSSAENYDLLHRVEAENSDEVYCLIDHKKIKPPPKRILFDLSKVDYLITDYIFSDEVKKRFENTRFIEV